MPGPTTISGTGSQADILRMISQMMGNPNGPPKYHYRKPKFIKLLPGDSGEGLPDVFFEDPYTFQPKPDLRGEIRSWGVFSVNDMLRNITRMMQQGRYYMSELKNTPEEQFVKVLTERKVGSRFHSVSQAILIWSWFSAKIFWVLISVTYPSKMLSSEFTYGPPSHLASNSSLSRAEDRGHETCTPISLPTIKTDRLYGPKDANSVDCITYRNHVGCKWLPDDEYMLAHLFASEGQKIGYLYDFGDKWYHKIVVEKILLVERSDGQVEVITGGGMCPGENMKGPHNYCEFLKSHDQDDEKREILSSPNYQYFVKPPALFDPDKFDMGWTKERLAEALASSNSVRSGMPRRNYVTPTSLEGLNPRMQGDSKLKKGQSIKQTFTDPSDFPGYFKETTSNKKDSRSVSTSFCGKPGSAQLVLKTCGGCRRLLYCSKEHQTLLIIRSTGKLVTRRSAHESSLNSGSLPICIWLQNPHDKWLWEFIHGSSRDPSEFADDQIRIKGFDLVFCPVARLLLCLRSINDSIKGATK
ncbi:plasmid p 4b orf-3 family protein [Moniliophthora roreri]|nr:plasmid p 4b orf-3 family protein [Moniliophthora roreri]